MKQIYEHITKVRAQLLNFAYTLTCNKDDADDLFQDTILKILKSEDHYNECGNFKGWAFIVMRNIFINNYKKIIANSESLLDDMSQLKLYNKETPESFVNTQEINSLISTLSPEFSEPLKLYISGYTYKEISQRMNIPEGTVKSRIFTVRNRLKVLLSNY